MIRMLIVLWNTSYLVYNYNYTVDVYENFLFINISRESY